MIVIIFIDCYSLILKSEVFKIWEINKIEVCLSEVEIYCMLEVHCYSAY